MEEEKLFFRNRTRIPKRCPNKSEKKKKEKEPIHIVRTELHSRTRQKFTGVASPVCSASAACVMEQAKEIQSSLSPVLPSFIKLMLPSHVAGGFWLGLPKGFCDLHLPKHDSVVSLEDEDGKMYETKFLFEKVGLSAGWRGFSIAHGLEKGDVLVFQLVKPCHWKVNVSRMYKNNEVDGSLSLLQQFPSCNEPKKRKHEQISTKSSPEISHKTPIVDKTPLEKDGPEDGDLVSEVLDGIRLCEFVVRFEDVKQPEDFVVAVDGLVIGGELSSHLRKKYYELCLSQNHFLHDNLIKGLNCKLVIGIISEIVNIADASRASRVTTSGEDFVLWEKTLRAFQDMGMDVGFLLTRLGRLMNLAAVWKSMRDEKDDHEGLAENMGSLELICQTVAKRKW